MAIDRVYILNLRNNIARRWACYSANVINGVPESRICIWRGIPGRDFGSIAEMVEGAVADGFPEFKELFIQGKLKERDKIGHIWI